MKFKTILNGIAALLAVGMFYTFSFCMAQDVNEESISTIYSYTEETAQPQKQTQTEKAAYKTAETASENALTAAEKTDDRPSAPKAPSDMTIPSFEPSPDEIVLVKTCEDEITDDNYRENSLSYSGFSDDELMLIFPEEDNVNDYANTSAKNSSGNSKSEAHETADKTVKKITAVNNLSDSETKNEFSSESAVSIKTNGSVVTANEINAGASRSKKSKKKNSKPFPEVSPMSSFDDFMGGSENGYDTYTSFDIEAGCGETLTAKVHGEVGEFDAYQLVCMIVANEMSPSFNMEALRAQAVAAYSYVKYHMDRGLTATVLVKEEVPDRIKEAVSSVWGQCCYYNGRPAQTLYTASTSGYTADAVNVWGGEQIPYLISKECPFDSQFDPNYGLEKTYTEDEIRYSLEKYLGITLSDNPENWITVTEYVDGNYVNKIDIDSQETISGIQMREKVLGFSLKSASFTVRYSDGEFIFTTYGYGHGVGMSQNGANILADQGYTYIDILKFYYEGITVE